MPKKQKAIMIRNPQNLVVARKPREKILMLDLFVDKTCPACKTPLSTTIFQNTEVDFCWKCLGLWFEDQELRLAKDQKDEDLKWLDIDLWKDKKEFKVSYGVRICPSCRMPLYEVYYGKSPVIVDVCNLCHGIWLERGEFKRIIEWLKKTADYKVLNEYSKNLFQEAAEIFTGPEALREEIADFLTILKLFSYKFPARHSIITKLISDFAKYLPR